MGLGEMTAVGKMLASEGERRLAGCALEAEEGES